MKKVAMCMTWAIAALLARGVLADMVLIDFGPAGVGSSTPDGSGGYTWINVGGNETRLDMAYAQSGIGSGIDLYAANWSGVNTWNAGLAPDPNLNGGRFAFETATRDGLYANAGVTGSIVLSNLNASLTYDLVLYGSRTDFERYTTYSSGASSVELQTGVNGSNGSGFNSNTVVTLSGLTPDANNSLTVDAVGYSAPGQGGSATFTYLNALEIRVVPEPTVAGLLVLGSAALVGAFRRRA